MTDSDQICTDAYRKTLAAPEQRRFACNANDLEELRGWEQEARPALRALVGLDAIADQTAGHVPAVALEEPEQMDGYTRGYARITTEPGVSLPFWLLQPAGDGPFPLALTPHGHDPRGHHTSVGIPWEGMPADRMQEEDRDVAVQAVQRGFFTIAPATRGIAFGCTEDDGRYDKRCRAHSVTCIAAGRSSIGERVWDMACLIDWAGTRDDVNTETVLMLGNSGGGVITLFSAACDPRITIAIPSCAYAPFLNAEGRLMHCDCNLVPGIMRFGEAWDVGSLIAPRPLLIVHGRTDATRTGTEIDEAVAPLRQVYQRVGAPQNFEHVYGPAGHRFYAAPMWAFVQRVRQSG